MNKKLILWSLVASLAGFLFGFDTVVISGAEQTIQDLWGLNDLQHGLAVSMALWGTVIGSLGGSIPSDKYGRKPTLLCIGLLYFISAVWSGLATDVYSFMIARFIGGLGVGVSTVAAPLFISEISPAKNRGSLTGFFQFNIVFGILIAFISNHFLSDIGENAWRWMLGVEGIPALIYSVICLKLPESPRWLILKRNDRVAAKKVLMSLEPEMDDAAREAKLSAIAASVDGATREGRFWQKSLLPTISLAFFISFFNQMSGINAILYFSPRIFELTGLSEQAALLQSIGIGVTNLIFTFIGLWLIDKAGRKTLLIAGSIGYIASLGCCAWAFAVEHYTIVPFCIFAFIASHAIGQGAVIWVFISEIFPTHLRARGQAFGCFIHWVFAASIAFYFPRMVTLFATEKIFLFFTIMMVIQLLWVILFVSETKGKSLEEISSSAG